MKNAPLNGLGGHPQDQAACLQLGLFLFWLQSHQDLHRNKAAESFVLFCCNESNLPGTWSWSLSTIFLCFPHIEPKVLANSSLLSPTWANILWLCSHDSVYNLGLLGPVRKIVLLINCAFPSNITFWFVCLLLARWGTNIWTSPTSDFSFMATLSMWPGSVSAEAARNPGFHPKLRSPFSSVLLVSHDHWVLPALLLMAYWIKSGQKDLEKWGPFCMRAWVIFQKVSRRTELEVRLFFPSLTAIFFFF